MTNSSYPCDGASFEAYLSRCSLPALLDFVGERCLIEEYELYGDSLMIRVENTSVLLDEPRALCYLRSLIRAYAESTGEWPRL